MKKETEKFLTPFECGDPIPVDNILKLPYVIVSSRNLPLYIGDVEEGAGEYREAIKFEFDDNGRLHVFEPGEAVSQLKVMDVREFIGLHADKMIEIDRRSYDQFVKDSSIKLIDRESDIRHAAYGIAEESGEILSLFKRRERDGHFESKEVVKELGDLLWYLTYMANLLGSSLEEVKKVNREKISKRLKSGKIQGSGNNR